MINKNKYNEIKGSNKVLKCVKRGCKELQTEDGEYCDKHYPEAKRYYTKLKMTSYLATAIAEGFCEGEGATQDEQHDAWQYLVDTGICWHLQGWFGRNANALLEQGLILPPLKDHVDYYGNIVRGTQK